MNYQTNQPVLPDLQSVLTTRREYCRVLVDLARQQGAFIAADDYSGLLKLIAQKQQVIELMHELAAPFGKLPDYWNQVKSTLPPATRTACQAALASAESYLAEALQIEQTSLSTLAAARDETSRELRDLQERTTYQRPRTPGVHLFDTRT